MFSNCPNWLLKPKLTKRIKSKVLAKIFDILPQPLLQAEGNLSSQVVHFKFENFRNLFFCLFWIVPFCSSNFNHARVAVCPGFPETVLMYGCQPNVTISSPPFLFQSVPFCTFLLRPILINKQLQILQAEIWTHGLAITKMKSNSYNKGIRVRLDKL